MFCIFIEKLLKFVKVQLKMCQHWFSWWLDSEQATSHYLNQCRTGGRPLPLSIGNNSLTSPGLNKLRYPKQNQRNFIFKFIANHLHVLSQQMTNEGFIPYNGPHPTASQIAKFMGPTWGLTWVLSAPDGPRVGPISLTIGTTSDKSCAQILWISKLKLEVQWTLRYWCHLKSHDAFVILHSRI